MGSSSRLVALTSLGLLLSASGWAGTAAAAAPPATNNTGTTTGTTPSCRTQDLTASITTRGGGTAGSLYVRLTLRNISARVCHIRGFTGVSFVAAGTGAQVGAPADWVDAPRARTLRVPPGGRVEATLDEVDAFNYPPQHCRPRTAKGLRVYPPNQTTSVYVPQAATGCRNPAVHLLTVTPLRRLR